MHKTGCEEKLVKDMSNTSSTTTYVTVKQLRVGLYVFIDLPWFRHPFALSCFRISSEEQISTLRSLGKMRFRCDPERSECNSSYPIETSEDIDLAASGCGSDNDINPSELAARHERTRVLNEHRRRIGQVDRAFLKSSSILRNLNRDLINKPGETLHKMTVLVDQMVAAFLDHSEVTLHVMGENCSNVESYSHSLNVSVLCMMLSKGLGLSQEQALNLGFGALLHDIGLVDVPDRVNRKRPEEYTKPERDLRAMHCEFGQRIGKTLSLSPEVLAIIFQHHEMADGTGYPVGSLLEEIAFPARIVSLVNFYDNLCNPVDPAQAMTPHEALSFMFGQRRAKFDAMILQQMIRCLGVYPPGSVVALSNETIGLVMSVNPSKPLRPWVMVYDAKLPKEEAILLNLEKEAEISIAKAMRPRLLPPAVCAYLSTRQRVRYYFDSHAQTGQGLE